MATIYASTNDGYVLRSNQASWSDARNNSSGTGYSSTVSSTSVGTSAYRQAARGGGDVYSIFRSFFSFTTSGISSNVDVSTLQIYGRLFNTGDVIAVKATSGISSLGTADFEAIAGWDSSGTDGSGGVDMESSVTKYSDEVTTWSSTGYNSISNVVGVTSSK